MAENSRNLGNRKIRKKRTDSMQKRLVIVLSFCLLVLISIGIFRVAYIKIVHGKEYEAMAISNQMNKIQDKIVNPNRGAILDRNKQALAVSSTVYNVALDVRVLSECKTAVQNNTIDGLSKMLEIPKEELNSYIQINPETKKPAKDTSWLVLKKKIPFQLGKKIEEMKLSCVHLEEDTKRTYPHGFLASQVVGFIRGDTIWGLEKSYNDSLLGTPGRTFRTYESDNTIVTREISPIEGNTIVTTIDQTIQQFAETICKNTYEACKPDHSAVNTSIIVMNPNNGEILAMAEYPTFDLNIPEDVTIKDEDKYKDIWNNLSNEEKLKHQNSTWKNFNITDTFEPGSIFKPIVIAAALEEGVLSPNDTFYCGGSKTYGKDTITCHLKSGHGTETIEQVLANSCNVGMMDIVSKMGREKFYKYQKDFGFGEKTGIDLPGEADAANLIYGLNQLNTVELATSSFGQGFNATSIQSLNAIAATINGGYLLKPHIVSQVIDSKGSIMKEYSTEIMKKPISETTSNYLRKAMESVIATTGTGKKAIIEGYSLGGKTGTAQQGKREDGIYTLDFIAYLPADNPEYVAMAVINRPEHYTDGIVSPVPMLRELFVNIINYKSIPPTKGTAAQDVNIETSSEVIIKDYTNKNLKDTIKELNDLGIDFEIAGGGGDIVTKQFPAGNSRVPVGNSILLYVGTSGTEKELVLLPDVSGLTATEAINILSNVGFEARVVDASLDAAGNKISEETASQEGTDSDITVKEKTVFQQIPAAGTNVEKGTIIKIKIK